MSEDESADAYGCDDADIDLSILYCQGCGSGLTPPVYRCPSSCPVQLYPATPEHGEN